MDPSPQQDVWQDAEHDKERFQTRVQADKRAAVVSEIFYKLTFALVALSDSYHGHQHVEFNLSAVNDDVFLDYRGLGIHDLEINGKMVVKKDHPLLFDAHKIQLPKEMLQVGKNVVNVKFHTPFVTDCQGMQKYKDETD
jgi:aminopeptidase N